MTLDADLPAWGVMKWASGALALNHHGNIYYIPFAARHILKLDSTNDEVSSVGVDL